jgi:hypothetical protein
MVSLRPRLHIPVQSFSRFDEILYLVEKPSGFTRRRATTWVSSMPANANRGSVGWSAAKPGKVKA